MCVLGYLDWMLVCAHLFLVIVPLEHLCSLHLSEGAVCGLMLRLTAVLKCAPLAGLERIQPAHRMTTHPPPLWLRESMIQGRVL